MASVPDPSLLEIAIRSAEENGIKLEMMDGITMWEALPTIRHQRTIDLIRESIRRQQGGGSDCGCHHFADIAIRFDVNSFKRPDVAIYCKAPETTEEATSELPDAVVEVVSRGYEAKDLEFGLPFYLRHGVREVVVYNPATLVVIHAMQRSSKHLVAPCEVELECGCTLSIPL